MTRNGALLSTSDVAIEPWCLLAIAGLHHQPVSHTSRSSPGGGTKLLRRHGTSPKRHRCCSRERQASIGKGQQSTSLRVQSYCPHHQEQNPDLGTASSSVAASVHLQPGAKDQTPSWRTTCCSTKRHGQQLLCSPSTQSSQSHLREGGTLGVSIALCEEGQARHVD